MGTEVFTSIMPKAQFSYPSELSVAGTNICITVDTIIENTVVSTRFQIGSRLGFTETSFQEIYFDVCCSLLELQFSVLWNIFNTNHDLHVFEACIVLH
jgi:hypothetical protein